MDTQGDSPLKTPLSSYFQLWTRRQRVALATLVLLFCGYLFVRGTLHPQSVSDPPPVSGQLAPSLASRIDPNTADWPALAALPLIGEKRAKDIIAWRDRALEERPDDVPFRRLEDLTRVKGIGKATIEALDPYLVFPQSE
jgi:hypothetical protein